MRNSASSGSGGFLSLPSTPFGKITGVLLVVALALIVVNVVFFNAPNEMGPAWLGDILRLAIGALVLAGLVTGALALVKNRDRSSVVWLSTTLFALVFVLEVVEVLTPGQ
jgi:hypothetical protein